MHLNIVKSKNALQYYVLESYRKENGKNTTRIVRKLGTHEQLLKEHPDPETWARSIVAEMNREAAEGKQTIMASFSVSDLIKKDEQRLYDGGYLFLQKIFHRLRLDYICKQISKRHGYGYDLGQILGHLIYSRILNPSSKLAAYEYAHTFLEASRYLKMI